MPPPCRGTCLTLSVVLLTSGAFAQPAANRNEAQERFSRAVTLFEQRNFAGALAEFERVFELTSRVDLLFNIGRTREALGQYPEAAAAVEEYLRRSPNLPSERRAEVEQLLANVRQYIAYLRVNVTPAEASVRLDGQPVAEARRAAEIPVSPGAHRVEASLPGRRSEEVSVALASGDHREVSLSLPVDDSLRGTLRVEGAPSNAMVFVDGTPVRPPAEVAVGRHNLRVEAPGRAAWTGTMDLAAGGTRTLRVELAARDQLSPGWFYASAVSSATLFALSGVFGALTLAARSEFDTLTRDDPRVSAVASRGEAFRAVTNVAIGLGVATAGAALYLAFRTRFGPEESSRGTVVLRGDGLALQF